MKHTIHIEQSSAEIIPSLVSALEEQNLFVTISFDLQQARANQTGYECPHHGTTPCTCQYAVLLVNSSVQTPQFSHTITVYGRDEQVWLSLLKYPALLTKPISTGKALETLLLKTLLNLATASPANKNVSSLP